MPLRGKPDNRDGLSTSDSPTRPTAKRLGHTTPSVPQRDHETRKPKNRLWRTSRASGALERKTNMAHTEVLLVKPVDGLGGEGDQVKVRAGYARNFLLPRKIAVSLNASNKKHVDSLKKRRAEREQTELNVAQELGKKLEKTSLAFAVKTGEGGRMFGAITGQDIHEKLVASGIELDKRKIQLHTPVKTLGKHTVKIRLHPDVTVEVPFDVVSENPIEPVATEAAPAGDKTEKRSERRPRKEDAK
jgi:large subunit ribosomal protein L9